MPIILYYTGICESMNIKTKSISIGIIAIFIGLAFTPMGSASSIENKETKLPVEISFYDNDGWHTLVEDVDANDGSWHWDTSLVNGADIKVKVEYVDDTSVNDHPQTVPAYNLIRKPTAITVPFGNRFKQFHN